MSAKETAEKLIEGGYLRKQIIIQRAKNQEVEKSFAEDTINNQIKDFNERQEVKNMSEAF